jgi:glycogen debranching enzyme
MSAWNADNATGSSGVNAVTVVEGSSFCISAQSADILPGQPQGAFYQDTRILSRWLLTVNDMPLEPLTGRTLEPYRAVFVGRPRRPNGVADSALVVEQERHVGPGLRNDIRVRNFSREPVACRVEIGVDADLADLFDVKGGRTAIFTDRNRHIRPNQLQIEAARDGYRRGVVISASGASMTENSVVFETEVPARGAWSTSVICTPLVEGVGPESPFTEAAGPVRHEAARRYTAWEEGLPRLTVTDRNVEDVLSRSQADLGSLRIFDADHPERLSSYMGLSVDPALATGTLQTLASLQGTKVDPDTEEEPGRILHEVRLGASAGLAMGGGQVYYGTADATPLFVTLLAEVSRWGLADDQLETLLGNADRALEWVENYGDRDGDGFVEYHRHNDHGLVNQGWKDSWDGINFADGHLAEPPIALCEVQAYVYSAYLGRALLAAQLGDQQGVATWTGHAADLKAEFNERFWLPDRGYFAVALDKDKRPVDACASNMGHCLWLGIVDVEKAPQVVERLMSPEMFSGWGIRTLASDMGAYNPVSYHNGSVWPHDTALIATGLMRYGFAEEAARVAQGLFAAAEHFDGRLPELFCGFSRREYDAPVPYPTSCSPQAWAAAAPVQLMRTLLRFDPILPQGQVHLAPILPSQFGAFRADQVRLSTSRITIRAEGTTATIDGLPSGMVLRSDARPRLEETLTPAYRHHPER